MLVVGEKSQKNGLQISLLERLHKLYSENMQDSSQCTASLIRNYRCVPEIVTLASNLYYESSLHSECEISPDTKYPLQFICSSIDNVEDSRGVSETEVEIILDKVMEYKGVHPDHKVCLVSPSPSQVSSYLIAHEKSE